MLSLILGGCSDGGEQGEAERQTLYVYTAIEQDQIPELRASFESALPDVDVEITRNSTGQVTALLLAESEAPVADVVWGLAATSLLIADERGMLAPYAPVGLERIAPRFRDDRDEPHWVGTTVWMTALSVNTIEMEARGLRIPASYADLIDPSYRGLVAMPNPASSGTGYLTVSAILQMMGESEGWDYLQKLHDNIAMYTHSGSKPARLAGSGEVSIGVSFGYRGLVQQRRGEPLEVVFPSEGSGWDMEANALVRKDRIKPAARRFLDWAISAEAMRLYNKSYAVVSDASISMPPEGYPSEPIEQLAPNDLQWAAENKSRVLERWQALFDGKSEAR